MGRWIRSGGADPGSGLNDSDGDEFGGTSSLEAIVADNKLVGIEVAMRLSARAVEDLADELDEAIDRMEIAVGRAETAATATKAEIATLTTEIKAAVSLIKELESRSLPSRIAAWATANPLQLVLLVGMLLLFQSGYAYLIPRLFVPAASPGATYGSLPPADPTRPPALSSGGE